MRFINREAFTPGDAWGQTAHDTTDWITISSQRYKPLKINWGETATFESEVQYLNEGLIAKIMGGQYEAVFDSTSAEPDETALAESVEDFLSEFAQK